MFKVSIHLKGLKFLKHIFVSMYSKKDNKSLNYIETSVLAFIWLIIFLGPIIFSEDTSSSLWDHFLKSTLRLLPFLALTLFNHFVLVPYLLFRSNKWFYFLSAILTSIVFAYTTPFLHKPETDKRPARHHQAPMGQRPLRDKPQKGGPPFGKPDPGPKSLPPQANSLLIALLILGFDTGLRTAFRWMKLEKEREKIEKESIKNELAFLRNQVSPHFFMNTLNNIHSLIDFDTEEAKDSVIRLSKLMRHLLYDSESDLISLNKELDFVRNYVDLMRMRYSSKVDISLHIDDNIPDKKIPPLLFTSYLENAFKHGISYQHHSFIHICIDFKNDALIFSIRNSNHPRKESDEPSGIGTENSHKRLELLFTDDYNLSIENTEEHYLIELNIPL